MISKKNKKVAFKRMIKTFPQAISYLRRAVPNSKNRFPGFLGLDRQFEILRLLDSPQNKIKAIHIAGTSGKSSTAFYLSSLLKDQDFNVGLTLSPHLLDIRERFQINNKLISKKEFIYYLNQIIPVIEKVKKTKFGKPTFFEILIALAFFIFYQKKVDYAVVETGLGGLMDGTNTISSPDKVSVFTRIGLDHTKILGSTITSIASQKAGIIHPYNPVFSIKQKPSVKKLLDTFAKKNKTEVTYIKPKVNFKNIETENLSLSFDFSFQKLLIPDLKIKTIALYQIENSSLALSVINFLAIRDNFNLDIKKIKKSLNNSKFYGRADIYQYKNKTLILDGAHNPQKMIAFIKSLKKFFPNQKFTFILSFKSRRDFSQMIKMIIPLASHIIITNFLVTSQDMIHSSQSQQSLIRIFKKLNFSNFSTISKQSNALKKAIQLKDNIIITGSLYLLGEIYPLLKSDI